MAAPRARAARWSAVGSCVDIAVKRSRAVPSGTVGGRMPWANTPCSSSASEILIACSESPMWTGTIWLSESPTGRPSAASASRRTAELTASRWTISGSASSSASASCAAATTGGGSAVEKMNERTVLSRYSTISLEPQT